MDHRQPLWSKECGSYVEIFSNSLHKIDPEAVNAEIDVLLNSRDKKDNKKAVAFREKGNLLYGEEKYYLALESFNRSLCYAEDDTNLAFAYANRASCYTQLKLYDECLKDIELAKKFNYPADKMHKLTIREKVCFDEMSKVNQYSLQLPKLNIRQVALSYSEHSEHAGIVDCVEVDTSAEWGRHLITTRNLDINDTIMIENPFSFVSHTCNETNYVRCAHCFKIRKNFIPCTDCVYAMFCNPECLREGKRYRHKFECKFTKIDYDPTNYNFIRCKGEEKGFQLVQDMLWKVTAEYDDVEELIRVVESIIPQNEAASSREAVVQNETMKQFEMILQLETNIDNQSPADFEEWIGKSMKVYMAVMRLPEFSEKFAVDEHKRFLQHLISHLVLIGIHAVTTQDVNLDWVGLSNADFRDYGIGMYPFSCFLNHSCVPNVYCYSVDDRLICKVIRPIKSGEQLFRSYIGGRMLIIDDPPEQDPSTSVSPEQDPPTSVYLKTVHKIDECRCEFCVRKRAGEQGKIDWLEGVDPVFDTIQKILNSSCAIFLQIPDYTRLSHVERAITYLNEHENAYPLRECTVIQMYLHNFWIITTAERD